MLVHVFVQDSVMNRVPSCVAALLRSIAKFTLVALSDFIKLAWGGMLQNRAAKLCLIVFTYGFCFVHHVSLLMDICL